LIESRRPSRTLPYSLIGQYAETLLCNMGVLSETALGLMIEIVSEIEIIGGRRAPVAETDKDRAGDNWRHCFNLRRHT